MTSRHACFHLQHLICYSFCSQTRFLHKGRHGGDEEVLRGRPCRFHNGCFSNIRGDKTRTQSRTYCPLMYLHMLLTSSILFFFIYRLNEAKLPFDLRSSQPRLSPLPVVILLASHFHLLKTPKSVCLMQLPVAWLARFLKEH